MSLSFEVKRQKNGYWKNYDKTIPNILYLSRELEQILEKLKKDFEQDWDFVFLLKNIKDIEIKDTEYDTIYSIRYRCLLNIIYEISNLSNYLKRSSILKEKYKNEIIDLQSYLADYALFHAEEIGAKSFLNKNKQNQDERIYFKLLG